MKYLIILIAFLMIFIQPTQTKASGQVYFFRIYNRAIVPIAPMPNRIVINKQLNYMLVDEVQTEIDSVTNEYLEQFDYEGLQTLVIDIANSTMEVEYTDGTTYGNQSHYSDIPQLWRGYLAGKFEDLEQ